MVLFIRKLLADLYDEKSAKQVPILYGGSVSEDNAVAFVTDGGATGLLVGRVSLEPKRFAKIAQRISL
jgi:triosephosphate isomerase